LWLQLLQLVLLPPPSLLLLPLLLPLLWCLQARGGSGQPLLECAYRQAVVLVDELKRNSLPAALVLDVPSICCGSSSGHV
jgi:hypothetical protein